DYGGHVRAAQILHRADAGRRGDVDLGEIAVDHVNADKQQPPFAQRRAKLGADLAFAWREVGLLWSAAAHHVRPQIIGRRHTVDSPGKFTVNEDDALVA